MFFALSKGILCAVALLCICAVLVACGSNFVTTANYLLNGSKNEIEYNELKRGISAEKLENNISSTTATASAEFNVENSESEFSGHDHGLILLDVTSQNLASAYRKYGISSVGIIVLESRYSTDVRFGDKIISVNGIEVYSSTEFNSVIRGCKVGEFIDVCIVRDNRVIKIRLKLEEEVYDSVNFD